MTHVPPELSVQSGAAPPEEAMTVHSAPGVAGGAGDKSGGGGEGDGGGASGGLGGASPAQMHWRMNEHVPLLAVGSAL